MQILATSWRSVRWLAAIAAFLLLAACSGGGGSGGGDSSSGDGFTVSATSLSFSADQNGALPPSQSIQTSFTHPEAFYVGAAYPPGATPVSWLSVPPPTGSGKSWTFQFSVNTSNLSPGTYTTTIGLGIARADTSIIAYKYVDISYTVRAKLTVSPAALNFSFVIGGSAPASQGVSIGGAGLAWTASANQPWVILNGSSGTAPGSLGVGIATNLSPGIYSATIQISDGNTSLSVPVTYTVRVPNIAVNPSQLTFSAINGGSVPPPPNITVSSETGVPISYTTRIVYSAGASGWLSVPDNGTAPGTLAVGHSTNVAPGSYMADIILTPSNGAPSVTVHVNYTVTASSPTLSPPAATFSIDASSTTADNDIKRTIIVSQTGSVLSWTATSSVPWLTVSPTSGTNYGTVTLTLVPAQLDALENGQHTAFVTFIFNGPYVTNQAVSLTVTLNLNVPKVNYVAPYVAFTNTSKQVIIRGSGFSNITNQKPLFGATLASSFSVLSDTEIRATHPVLAAGNYPVKIENGLGIDRSSEKLAVVDAPVYGATTIAYPNALTKQPLKVIYDAERRSLVVAAVYPSPGFSGEIFRYTYSGSGWSTIPSVKAVPAFRDLALSIDGRQLIAVSSNIITQFDSTTLATGGSINSPLSSFYYLSHLAMNNDGFAIVTGGVNGSGHTDGYRYSVRNNTLSPFNNYPSSYFYFGAPGSALDGSRTVIIQEIGSYVSHYNTSTGSLSVTNLMLQRQFLTQPEPQLDRTANRIILNGYLVYDTNYVLLGSLPYISWDTWTAVVISPDGRRAYNYNGGTVLHTYDLATAPIAGAYPEIGTGAALPSDPGSYPKMAISPDGGTLFIAGSNGIVVLPVP